MNTTLTQVSNLTEELFLVLSEKERNIITKRFSLSEAQKRTLEEIGREYNITRERVRQIEKNAIGKLRRTSSQTQIKDVFDITNSIITQNGGVMTEDALAEALIGSGRVNEFTKEILVLSFEINPALGKIKKSKTFEKSWFSLNKIDRSTIQKLNSLAEKTLAAQKSIISENEFLILLQEKAKDKLKVNLTKQLVTASLTISKKVRGVREGYGLTKWRSVKPKSIRDKALIVLNRANKPLHFKEISRLIRESGFDSKSVTVQAVHNELIRYDDFILIGRGIYALKEWGYKEGTVKDVIIEVLKDNGPLNKSDIIKEVLKRRQVKVGTISLNLQKYPEFERVGRAVYSIAKVR